jgi:hypothetical protein
MTRHRPPTLRQKLCAAYLRILVLLGRAIPHNVAAQMTEQDIEALFEVDHDPEPVANGGSNHPSNLVPRLKAEHREKTRRDIKRIAKGKRLARSAEETRRIILARVGQLADAEVMRRKRKHPLPCGKASGWKKPLGKSAVRRTKP